MDLLLSLCLFTVGHETEHWSVYRRYLEFYVLESKLTEFHGNVSACLRFLPPRTYHIPSSKSPRLQRYALTAPPRPRERLTIRSCGPYSFFLNSCAPRRLVPRRAVAFQENHRAQELRVPHVEAGGVPGVPSGGCRRGICHFNDGLKC